MKTAAGFDTESSTTHGGRFTHLRGIEQILYRDHGNSNLPTLIPIKEAIEQGVPIMSKDLAREVISVNAIALGPTALYIISECLSQQVGSPALVL